MLLPPPKFGGRLDNPKGMSAVSFAAAAVALLQSLCTAVLTINGIRVGIGLAALAAGSIWAPVRALHRDSIRIPMLIIAVVGALVNLAVLAWIWRLRARPEAQWRRQQIGKKQRRSERLQVAMAVLTLVLVGAETWAHAALHRHRAPAPAAAMSVKAPV
jgi:heme/copper-type cytochrome/quinol oxidase subunit 2